MIKLNVLNVRRWQTRAEFVFFFFFYKALYDESIIRVIESEEKRRRIIDNRIQIDWWEGGKNQISNYNTNTVINKIPVIHSVFYHYNLSTFRIVSFVTPNWWPITLCSQRILFFSSILSRFAHAPVVPIVGTVRKTILYSYFVTDICYAVVSIHSFLLHASTISMAPLLV